MKKTGGGGEVGIRGWGLGQGSGGGRGRRLAVGVAT